MSLGFLGFFFMVLALVFHFFTAVTLSRSISDGRSRRYVQYRADQSRTETIITKLILPLMLSKLFLSIFIYIQIQHKIKVFGLYFFACVNVNFNAESM